MTESTGGTAIKFHCTNCQAPMSAEQAQAGSSQTCEGCHAVIIVPQADAPRAASSTAPEQGAPVVVTQTVSPGTETAGPAATFMPQPGAATDAPTPATSMATAPEGATAMASAVAIDPNSSPEFKAASTPAPSSGSQVLSAPPRPYPYQSMPEEQAPLSRRTAITALSAVVVLALLATAGITINRGIERKKIEQDVTALVEKSRGEIAGNELDSALKDADKAAEKIKTATLDLDPELRKKWDAQIAHITELKEQVSQLEKIFAGVEQDLSGTRDKLRNKKTALGVVSDQNRPAVLKVEALLAETGKLEQKQKLDRIKAELNDANALYAKGEIEKAADRGDEIVKEMNDKPPVQDEGVENRVRVLRKRSDQLKDAAGIRMAAKSDTYAEARKQLQQRLSRLDESNADFKPLVDKISAVQKALIEDEKRTKHILPQDSRDLTSLVHVLHKFDRNIDGGKIEGDTIGMQLSGKPLRMGYLHEAGPGNKLRRLFIDASGYRLEVEPPPRMAEGKPIEPQEFLRHPLRVLDHAQALGEAMKKADVPTDWVWDAYEEAPLPSARRMGDDGKEYIFLGDKLYAGAPEPKEDARAADRSNFEKKTGALAQAVLKDEPTPEEVRRMIVEAIRATAKEADWYDHLPGEFVRKVIDDGYIERNMPGSAERLKKELAEWREAYVKIDKPVFNFGGTAKDGDEAIEYKTLEDHPLWRMYHKAADTTTFAINNPDDERNRMFVLYDFAGKADTFPGIDKAKQVRMTYQAAGVTAVYDPAAEKMTANNDAWNLCAALELPPTPPDYRQNKGLGAPAWAFPPHVLLIDADRNTHSIVTPYGKLDMKDFRKVPEADRKAEMSKFLDQMAIVMPTNNYLHLYFRYFHEYLLDSPVTSNLELMGSRTHSGNKQQTTYQSLMRMMGGRFTGDCGDLAELYMDVSRRNGKLSYVMALPQHAACGWLEKKPGETEYVFYMCDTGPPRIFRNADMDKVIEMAERAYDDENMMRIDPKSLGYLFRFNNEPTRTPYYLSSRMFIDKEYGEAMEKVQSYWHFHFYKLGIETMTAMVEKGDRVPENCIELAGLYGQIREVEDSIHWTNEALKQFSAEEKLSRMSEEFRIGLMWRTEHENEKSHQYIKKTVDELKGLYQSPQSSLYSSTRHEFMGLLVAVGRPWEAWDLIENDIFGLIRNHKLKSEHVGGLGAVFQKMKQQVRDGKVLTRSEKEGMATLQNILDVFFANELFENEDDYGEIMRKYAILATWYSASYGQDRLVAELLKDGPFPSPDKPRNHTNRKDAEDEDWNWIRLSLPAYSVAVGDALDFDDPPELWRKDEAVKVTDAMTRAAEHTKQFGSLGSAEFGLLSAQVLRCFLAKDWPGLEKAITTTGERDWARLTTDVAESFGRGARFCTPEEFVAQYRMFCGHIKARTAFFTVIYEAYRADGIEQAIAATKVALELNPGDEDMKREAVYLEQLGKKKLARLAEKNEQEKNGAAPKPESKKPEQPEKKKD